MEASDGAKNLPIISSSVGINKGFLPLEAYKTRRFKNQFLRSEATLSLEACDSAGTYQSPPLKWE